jgi:hypothetical protein
MTQRSQLATTLSRTSESPQQPDDLLSISAQLTEIDISKLTSFFQVFERWDRAGAQ